ncbi:hypothetical protein N7448_005390 [Penicillium atrosanguineum]|uniref:Uncharacterized protein n=1 Tax=Penicillium atrosanguineum TaxID=1132637 RepID=A0A9W9PNL5_9EURO|nr:hypothetical protein N7448_005390 [Penicillium atrosanguineum]KAJ5302796.1 hypothetical protein N7476_009595 [Penicillium atrosanguineum]
MTPFYIPTTALLALVASSAFATQSPNLLQVREDIEPGSPLYNCHEACGEFKITTQIVPTQEQTTKSLQLGEVILMSETANYCDNSTFTSYLESCLECAKTYDIWKYYGTEVKSAASNCSDDATPSPSSATTGAAATTTASGNSSSKASSSTITTTTVCT